jgi:hypothetical protein
MIYSPSVVIDIVHVQGGPVGKAGVGCGHNVLCSYKAWSSTKREKQGKGGALKGRRYKRQPRERNKADSTKGRRRRGRGTKRDACQMVKGLLSTVV